MITRNIVNGRIILSDGANSRAVPKRDVLREGLQKLIADCGGDHAHPKAFAFWETRARKTLREEDDFKQAYEAEVYNELWIIWDELIPPPPVHEPEGSDLFDMFDL